MTDLPTVTIAGKKYPLCWGQLAKIRYSGVIAAYPHARGAFGAAAMVWAAIAAKPHPFETVEHFIEAASEEELKLAFEALDKVLPKEQAAGNA
jgi:hypothetical protein